MFVYQRVGYVDVRGAERFKFDETFAEAARTTVAVILKDLVSLRRIDKPANPSSAPLLV